MQINQRRVNKLLLKLSDDSKAQTIIAQLEDAFNTASLPGLPPNRLVLIRRLDLGHLPQSCSNIQLSIHIDSLIRDIASRAVCFDTQPETTANVIWFQDELQPYLVASLRLAQGKKLDQWYWQSMFPAPDHRFASGSPSLVKILLQSAQVAETGPMLIGRHLLQQGYLATLLEALEPQHGAQLLRLAGYTPGVMDNVPEFSQATWKEMPFLSPRWNTTLQRWNQYWGDNDVRLCWLVSCAMQDSNPAQGVKRDLSMVQSVIRQLSKTHPGISNRNKPGVTTGRQQGKKNARQTSKTLAKETDPDRGKNLKQYQERHKVNTLNKTSVNKIPAEESNSTNETSPSKTLAKENDPHPGKNLKQYQERHKIDTLIHNEKIHRPAPEIVESENWWGREGHEFHSPCYLDYTKLQFTEFAGLPMVVSLLAHLGMANVLQDHDRLIQINFPASLLWSVAERFGIDVDDPAVTFIPDIPEEISTGQLEFCAPPSWQRVMGAGPHPRLLVQPHREVTRHTLTDSRNRMVLAIWYGDPPPDIKDMLEAASTEDKVGLDFIPDLQLLLNTFHLLMGLYLRNACAMSLRKLVNRPGLMATTNTHVDAIYAEGMVDMGLRKTGLDTNPDWVPWLGKIVQFHYQYEDEHYL